MDSFSHWACHVSISTVTTMRKISVLDIRVGGDSSDLTPKAMGIKAKVRKWDDIKLQSSAQQRKQ